MGRKRLKQKDRIQEVKKEVGTERQNPRGEKRDWNRKTESKRRKNEWRVLRNRGNKKVEEKGSRQAPAMKK